MRSLVGKKVAVLVAIYLTIGATVARPKPNEIERPQVTLSGETHANRVGEPVILKLTYTYKEPQMVQAADVVANTVHHREYLFIRGDRGGMAIERYPIYDRILLREDDKGLVYGRSFVLLYNHLSKEGLIFKEPGIYLISLWQHESVDSPTPKPLRIEVKPASEHGDHATSLLADANDYAFLEFGLYDDAEKRSEGMSSLAKTAEEYPDTLLGKWSAARLGIEHWERLLTERSDAAGSRTGARPPLVEESRFGLAKEYLELATALPDQIPLRERSLSVLVGVESARKNYRRVLSLLDELASKYPAGEYGRMAAQQKAALLAEEDLPKELIGQRGSNTVVWLGVAVGVLAVVILVFVRVRRRSSR